MNEKEFIQDVYDVLCGNTHIITQQQFYDKYIANSDPEVDCITQMINIGQFTIGLI